MALATGTRLGQYEILDAIGAGGMGEVYRARDTKLGREVAIKVLPDELSRDAERRARFEREAKLLAALNHPFIATLHGLEEAENRQFLVMELVEGDTLAERIAQGSLPVKDALPLFIQIAEGLEAAHEKGILHRDLKPANVKITPDGKPKILDFGLAKLADSEAEGAVGTDSQSPTLTRNTALGAILGTAAYMSPEQARGKRVDRRTDIWVFGCCLYESLTGKRTFDGETVPDTLSAVLGKEPDWSRLPASTPRRVRTLLSRTLRKETHLRLQHIGDARVELLDAIQEPDPEVRVNTQRPTWMVAVALVAGVAIGVWAVWPTPVEPLPPAPVRFTFELPERHQLVVQRGFGRYPPIAISRGGHLLAFAARDDSGVSQ